MKLLSFLILILCGLLQNNYTRAQNEHLPFYVQSDLFDSSQPNTLGLTFAPEVKTYNVFHAQDSTDKYCNGVVLTAFKGYLYAQWQSSSRDEDAPDTWVAYSRSSNINSWSKPMILAPKRDEAICTNGGWWTDGETLVAYINVWPHRQNPKGGYTEYMISSDGIKWSEPKHLLTINNEPVNGIIEQDLHALPNGRILTAVHDQPGLIVAPYYTDDPLGIKGWTKGLMKNLPHSGTMSREIEPSWFYQSDGNIVMIFRDQEGSFRKLASVSSDNGITWSVPVLTGMPDSRSKQCAGNFPNGTAFMVNNPNNNKNRFPLVITLSRDGKLFNKAYLLRDDVAGLQPLRYEGRFKRLGYHYPKAIVWKNFIYVSYATNKEDVEVTQVPLSSLLVD